MAAKEGETMTIYANRGRTFEEYIEYSNRHYESGGDGLIFKQHTHFLPIRDRRGKVVSCKVDQKAICDYVGIFHGKAVAIEAKETQKGNIRFDAVQPHQADFLERFERLGGLAFVVVSFDFKRFFCIPWEYWWAWSMKAQGKDAPHEYWGWVLPDKKSVRPEDLLPEWEVEAGVTGALDYLAILKG
jgi:recombination protein U